jgi:hypothetical protein
MSYWNHRVTRRELAGEVEYAIREVHYDNSGKIMGWTAAAIPATGETVEEVREALERMLSCTVSPVIDITDEDNPIEEKK